MASVKFVEASGVAPTVASSTLTVTLYEFLTSKFAPPLKRSSLPTIENEAASGPDSDSTLVPSASSTIVISATLIAGPFSGVEVTVFDSSTAVGASLTSQTDTTNDQLIERTPTSVLETVTE